MATDTQTRRLLLIGFGGLLLLLAFSGLTGLSVLRRIESQNASIRDSYFNRGRILEELRPEIYLSGTYVRDLLLEQDPAQADSHRRDFVEIRKRIDVNVEAYERVLSGEDLGRFRGFKSELDAYFNSLQPALEWNAAQRRELGYAFMRDSLLPRRMEVVHLADQIGRVNEAQLEVGNRQIADLFSRFRKSLVLLLVTTMLCGVLLAMGSFRRILRLEQLSEQARESLRDLSSRLISVQESERRSLSRELHDEVGQALSALLLGIGNVAAVIPPEENPEARAQLVELRRLAERTVATVRDMSLLLRPSMLDDLGLIPALQWQAREVSRNNDIDVQVDADSAPDDISDEHKTCVYRIVQEAMRNTCRHARAKNIWISLTEADGKLQLTIRDDGRGFSPEREKGLGLMGMEERVGHFGGSFRTESSPGKGTSIHVELPVPERVAIIGV